MTDRISRPMLVGVLHSLWLVVRRFPDELAAPDEIVMGYDERPYAEEWAAYLNNAQARGVDRYPGTCTYTVWRTQMRSTRALAKGGRPKLPNGGRRAPEPPLNLGPNEQNTWYRCMNCGTWKGVPSKKGHPRCSGCHGDEFDWGNPLDVKPED